MRRNHGAISQTMMFNLIESRRRVFRSDQLASYRIASSDKRNDSETCLRGHVNSPVSVQFFSLLLACIT